MTRLWADTETFSPVPITHGTHAYAARAEIMLFAWAIDDGPVSVWDCVPEPMPDRLRDALCDDQVLIYAHNSHFDRTVMRHAGSVIERAAAKNLARWRDTMVKALCHGLPGALEALCDILEVPHDQAKDKAGRQLIQLFCKPRPAGSKIHRADRKSHPAEWARFVEYAALDITAMRAIDRKLPEWNYRGAELALWHLDQRINDRGFAVDVEFAEAAVQAVGEAQKTLARRTSALTNGDVERATQRDQMLGHILAEYGVDLPDMQAATIERRAADPDLPPELRELLSIRLQASTSSTSKYSALLRSVSSDGRLRGGLQYSAATRTRRWGGRLFQPQNLFRPDMPQAEIEIGIEAIKAGVADLLYG
jgi:DNA polymerase